MWQLPFHSLTLGLGGPHLPSWRRGVKSSSRSVVTPSVYPTVWTDRKRVCVAKEDGQSKLMRRFNEVESAGPPPQKKSWLQKLNAKAFPELCACPAARQTKAAALSPHPQGGCTSTTVETTTPLVLSLRWLPVHYYAAKNTFGGYLWILRTLSSSIASVMRGFLDESGEKIMSNHSSSSVSI